MCCIFKILAANFSMDHTGLPVAVTHTGLAKFGDIYYVTDR